MRSAAGVAAKKKEDAAPTLIVQKEQIKINHQQVKKINQLTAPFPAKLREPRFGPTSTARRSCVVTLLGTFSQELGS